MPDYYKINLNVSPFTPKAITSFRLSWVSSPLSIWTMTYLPDTASPRILIMNIQLTRRHVRVKLLRVYEARFWYTLRAFLGDLHLCCGNNLNSFWKCVSCKVCTYHPCIEGLFKGQYILPFLTYYVSNFNSDSQAYFWLLEPTSSTYVFQTSQKLRMLSRSLSDCKSLLLSVMIQVLQFVMSMSLSH